MSEANGSTASGRTSGSATKEQVQMIIVGAGFAGLACAIEATLKGHHVILLEKFPELKVLGDIISFGANAGRIFMRWGLHDQFWTICTHLRQFHLHTWRGDLIDNTPIKPTEDGIHHYNGHRGELHKILMDHAIGMGIDLRFGQQVTEYWETDDAAGVVANGERLTADVVIGADGVHSKAREKVLGYFDKPRPSGYAVYRAWFTAKGSGIDEDPLSSYLVKDGDAFYGWIGKDVHFLTSSSKGGKDVSWVITHKDEADIEESWQFPGKMEDVLKIVDGWDPRCAAILSKAPSCVDWKLVYRDPLPTWLSRKSRIALIGDAAHPFLPTSAQGASQAIEDGVTLAVNLKLAGKKNVQLALQAFEKMRYGRVRGAQLTGEFNRDRWHNADADAAKKDPDSVRWKDEEWIMNHDAEQWAFKHYEEVTKDLRENGYKLPELEDDDKATERVLEAREEYLARVI
ncbi:FAD/NADP-binding domain-containing protein [Dacryopinax primogenitus]|uniref:FAD/NADP-binding domain-containing protein n=1 Tax=Dacryopinax primogenitus (strain DJM 731) TaxID=1858805 RepID=M5G3H9_DACPD|nr:FAD/NADP-binding domain-containing protein [Dacryopinax primogenitus]EJU03229.1 FAD/NADP-binding domain-containing protein [Dacryopinax primogenitus]